MNNKQAKRLRRIAARQPDLRENLLVMTDKGVVRLIPDCYRKHYHILKDMFLATSNPNRLTFIKALDSL